MSSCSTKLFILALTSTSDKTPSGFIAFKDIKIISIDLSENAFDGLFKLKHLSFFE